MDGCEASGGWTRRQRLARGYTASACMPNMLRCAISLALLTLLPSIAVAQNAADIVLSTVEDNQKEFDFVPCKREERLPAVRALFERMGAKAEDIQSPKQNGVENVVVRRSASVPTLDTVIVGAHYDFLGGGCGAVDNWTGIVVLAHLYKSIGRFSPRKNILFVAFDQEEKGLVGSGRMAKAIKKEETSQYCAMINLDSFGLAVPFALGNVSSASMIRLSEDIADELQVPFVTATIRQADADSSSFLKKDIPAITLSGLSSDWQKILHGKNDQPGRIQPFGVYAGYRIALSMWARIDESSCNAFAPAR